MELNYENIRPMDGVCTASSKLFGRLIRLWTAKLKGYNGFDEFTRLFIANHFGYVIEMNNKYWIAEMVRGGLKINSLKEYLKDPEKEKIVSIVRNKIFDNTEIRNDANFYIIQKAYELVDYDYKGSPGAFLGLCGEGPKKWYCSEMGEMIVNMYGTSWDKWQLGAEKNRRIAPVEIQFGKNAIPVKDWLK